MKYFGYILRTITGIVIAAYLVLLACVNTNTCQQRIAHIASTQLTKLFKARTEIERVEVGLFNTLTLHHVEMDDPESKEVLRADYMKAKMDLWTLIAHQRINIHTLALLDTQITLGYTKEKGLNIQYILDAFKSSRSKKRQIDLTAGVIVLRRCQVNYEGKHNMRFNDVNLNMSLGKVTPDTLALRIRHCAFRESRGIQLNDLSCRINAGKHTAEIQNMVWEMPHSGVEIPTLRCRWDATRVKNLPDFLESISLSPTDVKAHLATQDFKSLLPRRFHNADYSLTLNTTLSMAHQRIRVERCELSESQGLVDLSCAGHVRFNKDLHDGAATIHHLLVTHPRYGTFNLKGDITMADKEHGSLKADITTPSGTIQGQAALNKNIVSAKLRSEHLALAELLQDNRLPSLAEFSVDGTTSLDANQIKATLNLNRLQWKGYEFAHITADGYRAGKQVALNLTSNCDIAQLSLSAKGSTDLSEGDIEGHIQHWGAFLPKNWRDVAGHIKAQLNAPLSPKPTGVIDLSDCTIRVQHGDSTSTSHLNYLHADSRQHDEGVNIHMNCDFARAQFNGAIDPKGIYHTALRMIQQHLPSIQLPPIDNAKDYGKCNFALYVHDTQLLQDIIQLPLNIHKPLTTEGMLDGKAHEARLLINSQDISISGVPLTNVRLYATSDSTHGEALLQAEKATKTKNLVLNAHMKTSEDKLHTALYWREPSEGHYYGELALQTIFSQDADGKQKMDINLTPTNFCINDTIWHVGGGTLNWANKRLQINNLEVGNGMAQRARINGCYSKNENDSILANLQNIDVKYILDLVNFRAVSFEGDISGDAVFKMKEGAPHADFAFSLPHLIFNGCDVGHTLINGSYENSSKRVYLNAQMDEDGRHQLSVNGHIGITEKALELNCYPEQLPVAFINQFVQGIFEDIQGRASGYFKVYGPFHGLDFNGDLTASADITIPFTGVRYNVDNLHAKFTPGCMSFEEGTFNDRKDGHGTLHGRLWHNHLKDMRYDFEADVNNALVYDMPRRIDWNFYAKVIGSGHIQLQGQPGMLRADIAVTPQKGTDFTFINDTPETIDNVGHVRFGSKNTAQPKTENTPTLLAATPQQASPMDILLNFNVNVNPDANLHVLMDEKCGDVINLYGRGAINASYYNKGDFLMYGTCHVDHGEYRFSIQDIIRKNFRLQEGGEVVFTGSPADAKLDVQAIYTINSASLTDLNAGTSFTDNNVRVNCLLNIGGTASAPEISFDIDLPTVNEDEKQMVRKLIATEEDMNMQIIYLLGIGRFYTYNAATMSEGGANQLATNSVNSFLSNTLSSQLNEMFTNALRTNNWSLGANLATGDQGWNDMEVEALLSGRLFNNRLLLNGQFGYRDKATVANSTNFIGDFDLQYLLTKNGNIRLKAYSETNDRYFTKSALTTQGLGIMLKKDFNHTLPRKKTRNKK